MNMPQFTAQASLYRTSNRYRSSAADFGGSIADQSVIAAYIPGPRTQEKCSGCTDVCVGLRDVCLAEVAVSVSEARNAYPSMRARSKGGRSRSETQSRLKNRPNAPASGASSSSRICVF